MSGLFAVAGRAARSDPINSARRMGRSMLHRPNQRFDVAALAHDVGIGRIGLGLLNAGQHPSRSSEGRLHLWLCGEFYFHDERRRGLVECGLLSCDGDDADFARAVFQRDGVDGLTRLDGAFSVLIWDELRRRLTYLSDRFGLYPHYLAYWNGSILLAPEVKAILTVPGFPRRPDDVAIAQFTRFQHLLGSRTWLEDVQYLPPASIVHYQVDNDDLTTERYWDWDDIHPGPAISHDDAADQLAHLFGRAVNAMLTPALRPGIFLSGGMDSRTILAWAARSGPIPTLTFGQPNCQDVVASADLARRAGSPHHWVPFENGQWVLDHLALHFALTEGMHSFVHMHGISALDVAREHFDVNLSGWDGGTILSGSVSDYPRDSWFRNAPSEQEFRSRMYEGFCREFSWPGLLDTEAHDVFAGHSGALNALAFESLMAEISRTVGFPADRRAAHIFVEQHTRRADGNMIVFGRSTIEQRFPFFDHSFIDFLYSLPAELRHSWRLHQAVLTRGDASLALVPDTFYNLVPHENRIVRTATNFQGRARRRLRRQFDRQYRPPHSLYADYEDYLRTDLRDWVEAILFDSGTIERGIYDATAVRALWLHHLAGDEIETLGKIVPLINVELAMRAFVDGDGSEQAISAAIGLGSSIESFACAS